MRLCGWGQTLYSGAQVAPEIWAVETLGGSSLCSGLPQGGHQEQQLWYDARKAVQVEDNEGL